MRISSTGWQRISTLSLVLHRLRYPYRRVQVDEDGARDVFAAAGLGEEGLEGAALGISLALRVGATIGLEAVLQEVASAAVSVAKKLEWMELDFIQLPGAVAELDTGLADVDVADLRVETR